NGRIRYIRVNDLRGKRLCRPREQFRFIFFSEPGRSPLKWRAARKPNWSEWEFSLYPEAHFSRGVLLGVYQLPRRGRARNSSFHKPSSELPVVTAKPAPCSLYTKPDSFPRWTV